MFKINFKKNNCFNKFYFLVVNYLGPTISI